MSDPGAPRAGQAGRTPPDPAALTRPGVVGVIAALPAEAASLAHRRPLRGRPTLVGPQTWLCLAGVGRACAQAACQQLLASGATGLVSWGVAAGLDPDAHAGTVVITSEIVTPLDSSASTELRVVDSVARDWVAALVACIGTHAKVSTCPIADAGHVLETVEEKRSLAQSGAGAADMETVAVARIARSAGIPWIAIRAVADTATVALPRAVIRAVDASGQVRLGRLAAELARHPRELWELPQLARGFRAALRTLRTVTRLAGLTLLVPPAQASRDGRVASARSGMLA